MTLESLRNFCLSLAHVTEDIQWECVRFKIGDKMFALAPLEPGSDVVLSFKCSEERFAELVERPGFLPAPYLARAHWIGLEHWEAARDSELRELLGEARLLVMAKLPRKLREQLLVNPVASVATKTKKTRSRVKSKIGTRAG